MTLKADMLRALEDEESSLKDVTLVGSDGESVSATKAVLAIRSPVFKRMFFGNFQEASSDKVPMDYRGVVLQVVVKYCFVDELDLDLLVTEEADHMPDAEAVAMVQVRDAANYLELFDLHKTLSNELGESILADQGDLGCVCAVLQELMARGGADGPMWATFSDLVEAHPEACFLPKEKKYNQGVMACSLPLLEKLWESTKMDAFVAVKALQKWNDEHEASDDTQAPLQALADKIRLETISTTNLAEIKPCALFSMERLYNAFVHHGKSLPASINSSPLSSLNSFTKNTLSATVRGAGVECANGAYTWIGGLTSNDGYYQMVGNYGDLPCWYRLKKTEGTRWTLVVATGQVHAQELILYESSAGTVNKPAFALWNCVDGKDPTPYVSVRGNPTGGFFNNNNVQSNNNPLPESNIDQVADAFRAQTVLRNTNNHARRRLRVRPFG